MLIKGHKKIKIEQYGTLPPKSNISSELLEKKIQDEINEQEQLENELIEMNENKSEHEEEKEN